MKPKQMGHPVSHVATKAIEPFLASRQKKREITESAGEYYPYKGLFVSQKAVGKRVNSWGTDSQLDKPAPDMFPGRTPWR